MSSMSQYRVEVSGLVAERNKLAAMIVSAANGQADDGDIVVEYARVMPDWEHGDEGRAFWITPVGQQLCGPTGDALVFQGESRNIPPVRLLMRLSEQYPMLEFVVESTTEHRMMEKWIVQEGGAKLIDALEEGINEPDVHYVRDGEVLRELPGWIRRFYRLNKSRRGRR